MTERCLILPNPLPGLPPTPLLLPLGRAETSTAEKVKEVSRSKFCDLVKGLYKSKIVRAIVVVAIAVAVVCVLSNPIGWLATALAVSAFAAYLIAVAAVLVTVAAFSLAQGKQKTEFEISACRRLIAGENYNEIELNYPMNGGRLILGALPNRLSNDGEHLANNEKVGAILSVNEDWELDPLGLSLPYRNEDLNELGIERLHLPAKDHKLLSVEAMHKAADFIAAQMRQGKTVYVHCRAGVGRSAMAVAAYLMKYESLSVQEAIERISDCRKKSTIGKKTQGLKDFHRALHPAPDNPVIT
jgi:protein-tyrosine phosphatase